MWSWSGWAAGETSIATERLVSNMRAIEESLRRIAQNMTRLNAEKQSIDPYDVRHRIEELFADDLTTFVDGPREHRPFLRAGRLRRRDELLCRRGAVPQPRLVRLRRRLCR